MATIEQSIEVQVPVSTAYNQWTQFEEFPTFMEGVTNVEQIDDRHLHWVAEVGGVREEWDAEITQDEPGRIIAWRSIEAEEDNVRTAGAVEFESLGEATRVMVTLDYEAPAGALGETIAKIFANPSNQVEQDLERFKASIESNAGYNERNTEKVVGSQDDAAMPMGAGTPPANEANARAYDDPAGFDVILLNASINHIDEQACIVLHRDVRARDSFRRVFTHIAVLARPGARLVVADCSRAVILRELLESTRPSFSPVKNSTAGYAVPSLTRWYGEYANNASNCARSVTVPNSVTLKAPFGCRSTRSMS